MASENGGPFDPFKLEPDGVPEVVRQATGKDGPEECPFCGCKTIYEIKIRFKPIDLPNVNMFGIYAGCPACPFMSGMLVVSEFGHGLGNPQ